MFLRRRISGIGGVPPRLAEEHAEMADRCNFVGGYVDVDALKIIRKNLSLSCRHRGGPLRATCFATRRVVGFAVVSIDEHGQACGVSYDRKQQRAAEEEQQRSNDFHVKASSFKNN